eukprot:5684591-Amphidinium_carterae.1
MLFELKQPLLDRKRYESAGNFWRPLMFSSSSTLGSVQDLGYLWWNWAVQSVWEGPLDQRFFGLFVAAVFWYLVWMQATYVFAQLPCSQRFQNTVAASFSLVPRGVCSSFRAVYPHLGTALPGSREVWEKIEPSL